MFGYLSNSISFGQRPQIGVQITGSNLVSLIPPATIWYDFSSNASGYVSPTNVASGSAITAASDRTGKAHPTTTKGGTVNWLANASGTNGAANTGTAGGYLNTPSTSYLRSLAGMTVIVVAKPTTAMTTGYLCNTDQGDLAIYLSGSGANLTWTVKCSGGTGVPVTATGLTLNTWQVFSFVFNGAGSGNANRLRFRYNKADVPLNISGTVAATANSSNDNYVWFSSDSSTSNPFKGQIGEVLLFNAALGPGQVSAVEQYLGSKWGA